VVGGSRKRQRERKRERELETIKHDKENFKKRQKELLEKKIAITENKDKTNMGAC
jgi:hypothetical protein